MDEVGETPPGPIVQNTDSAVKKEKESIAISIFISLLLSLFGSIFSFFPNALISASTIYSLNYYLKNNDLCRTAVENILGPVFMPIVYSILFSFVVIISIYKLRNMKPGLTKMKSFLIGFTISIFLCVLFSFIQASYSLRYAKEDPKKCWHCQDGVCFPDYSR